uniref:Kinesin-like protein 6 n=1 Tax=Monodelphis domestica TaxID=13616 RepID=F7GCY0_MONDO
DLYTHRRREKNAGSRCVISMHSGTTTIIHDPKNPEHMKSFTFDLAYWSHSGFQRDKDGALISTGSNSDFAGQKDVFRDLGQGILDSAWQGYNATLLAYGQTGSGKSYSMIGYGADKGIIPNVCEELFKATENKEKNQQYQVTFSMLEIYNEEVRDLLSKTKKPRGLKVREDQHQGFYVDGLTSVPCDSYAHIERLMEQGIKARTTAATSMNATSSRSHMVITIQFKQVFLDGDLTKQSIINLVDLAGSERQKSSGSEGDRLREGSRVNLSLTTLGNVISALADVATGKRVLHIPYRDSVLTRLLQSALGGNSKTIMIAAISPADICYEETLSTLRYHLLAKNQARLQTIQITWEHQLEEARKEWEEQYSTITQERQMMKAFPYLFNVNEDPQLTGVLKHFIQAGSSNVGQAASNKMILQGLGISDKHATFTNIDGEVTVMPQSKCRIVVNGVPTVTKTKLQHLDRVILGSNSAYLYIGFPSERSNDDVTKFDYDFFQSELAAAEGVSVDKLGAGNNRDGKVDPSVLAVFQDYIKLIPLVAEANQMSKELRKPDLETGGLVWIWSKAKFINRKYLMEEIYRHFLDGENISVAQEDDPFWDPVEAIHLGSAHVWLQSLAYCMKLEEQAELLNSEGLEEAVVLINIIPCSSTGEACSEDDMVINPLELLGRRIDFQIQILKCLGVKWLKEDARRGIQIGYKIYDLQTTLYTKSVWKTVNAKIEETVHFVALNASHEFLNYLQKNALIVDLWGLQEGCAELNCTQKDLIKWEGYVMVDNMKTSPAQAATSNQMADVYLKLLKLEQETELLRNMNRALREENMLLKDSLRGCGTGQGQIITQLASHKDVPQMCSPRTSHDADFAKALKVFYQRMNIVRGQFLKLRHYRPPDDDQMLRPFTQRQSHLLKDIGELLEDSLWKLKNDVALIVKKKRESLVHTKYRGSSFP